MWRKFVYGFLPVLFILLVFTAATAVGEFRETLIEGQEYQLRMYYYPQSRPKPLSSMKAGETLSDSLVDICVLSNVDRGESGASELFLRVVPSRTGIGWLGGVHWDVLPAQQMPEELLGTWRCPFESCNMYFTFHEDGIAGCWRDLRGTDDFFMCRYLYSDGVIKLSEEYCFITTLNVPDGIPVPESGWTQTGIPRKISGKNANWITKASLAYTYERFMEDPGILLFDPDDTIDSRSMCREIRIQKTPAAPYDSSLQFRFSDPDLLEVACYTGWSVFLRGKKEGTAELYAEPYVGGKASNTLKITVLEGEKTLPENLLGRRWTMDTVGYTYNLVFGRNGRFIEWDDSPQRPYLFVTAGSYLYRDGMIQIGSANDNTAISPREYAWFFVDSDGESAVLRCVGVDNALGIWYPEELQTGIVNLSSGKYPFNADGVPSPNGLSGDELWMYYRNCSDNWLVMPQE